MKTLFLTLAACAALLTLGTLAHASEADQPPAGWQNIPQVPENPEARKLVPALTLFGGGGYLTGVENRGKQHGEGFGLGVGSLSLGFRATQHFIITPQFDFGLGGGEKGARWSSSVGVLFGGRTYGDRFRMSAGISWLTYNNLGIKEGGWWFNGVGVPIKMDIRLDKDVPVFLSIMGTPAVGINRGKHVAGGLEFLGLGIGGDLPSPF